MIKKLIFTSIIGLHLCAPAIKAHESATMQTQATQHESANIQPTQESGSTPVTMSEPAEFQTVSSPTLYDRLILCMLLASVDLVFKFYENREI